MPPYVVQNGYYRRDGRKRGSTDDADADYGIHGAKLIQRFLGHVALDLQNCVGVIAAGTAQHILNVDAEIGNRGGDGGRLFEKATLSRHRFL